jgi:septal ring factor EnvC (AmiA/AmiB activator)
MMEQIKFTQEEINSINQLKTDVELVFTQLGQLSVERKRRNDEIDEIETQLLKKHHELVNTEQELFKSLNEKYGDGNYDPNTGIFTPINNEVTQ